MSNQPNGVISVKDLSIDQLKSLAYDTKLELERHQTNLYNLESEIQVKLKEEADAREAAAAPKDEPTPESTDDAGQSGSESDDQHVEEPVNN